jgi:hypothetical protein
MATTIRAYWDEQDADNVGWYAMQIDENGTVLDDSQKIWWPVSLDYERDEAAEVEAALRAEFPGATIEMR